MRDEKKEKAVWTLGSEASLQDVYISARCPVLLKRSLSGAFTWQNRNRRQVHRSLLSASIAPQWSAALLALGATVTLQGDSGSSEVLLEDLLERRVTGMPLALHVRTEGIRWGEAHVGRTPADEPIVAVVAAVEMRGGTVRQARLALTGVWPRPVGLAKAAATLAGGALDKDHISSVARAVAQEVAPEGDFRGSVEYRKAMAEVLTRRALEQCLTDARQEVEHG
jgi:carbon-monoxide dehydrogenase medium subunit